MKRGSLLVVLGIAVLLVFIVYFLRQGDLNIPPTPDVNTTPSPSPTSTPSAIINRNITEVIEGKNNLKLFYTALRAGGLDNTLKSGGPYTVFAPSDTAIINNISNLPQDISSLRSILQYHIVNGSYTSNDLVGRNTLRTIRGDNLIIDLSKGDGVTVNGINISEPDIRVSNGIIHVINGVFLQ